MKWKDATRSIGSVGSLLSVLMIFLVSAGVAYACPEHGSKVVQRTKLVRTSPLMRTTLITYGRCGESSYRQPKVKYVAMRDNGYYSTAPRYVAVRKVNGYQPMSRTRYIAVRNDDLDYAPRYVTVRRQPAYVDADTRYVVMRNKMPRTRYVAVRDYDMDDYDTRYVAVRRYPVSNQRYVAVRDIDYDYVRPARYVAFRNNGCACPVRNGNVDDVETLSSPRHVVVKSDYIDDTEEVIYSNASYDDTAYVDFPSENNMRYVSYASDVSYRPVTYVAARKVKYVPTYNDNETVEYVSTSSNYVPTYYDSEVDDQAILDTSDATYVAVDDIENACLRPVARRALPVTRRTRTVNYVPVPTVRHVAVVDDDYDVVDADAAYVVAEPDQLADTSTVFVEETAGNSIVAMSGTRTLAGANGYRDGFEEGKEDANDGNGFEPTNSGNFRDGNNGYKNAFGDKNGYADAYRDSYLKGYRAGFDSRTYSY